MPGGFQTLPRPNLQGPSKKVVRWDLMRPDAAVISDEIKREQQQQRELLERLSARVIQIQKEAEAARREATTATEQLETVRRELAALSSPEKGHVLPRGGGHILFDIVAAVTGASRSDIASTRRGAKLSKARHLAFWLFRHFTLLSLSEIGGQTGGKDHTTVLYGVRRVDVVASTIVLPDPAEAVAWAEALWAADWEWAGA